MQAFISEIVPAGSVDFSKDLFMKIYFSGCDFKCSYCNTPDLLETKFDHVVELKDIKKEIERQAGTVKGVLITGGEPCFQRQALLNLLTHCKSLKLDTIIHTNGSKPDVLKSLLKNELLTQVIMDFKSPFTKTFEKITKSQTFFKPTNDIMKDLLETLKLLRQYDEKTKILFRTTVVPGLLFRKEDFLEMAKEIESILCSWELKAFSNSVVLDKQMRNITRPTQTFLENIITYLKKEIPNLNVKIV
jgi:pyruvate formate lyase activating enzyme